MPYKTICLKESQLFRAFPHIRIRILAKLFRSGSRKKIHIGSLIPASHLLFFRGKLYWGLDPDPYNFLRDPGPGKSYGSCGTAALLLNERICILKDTGCNRVPKWEICKLRERALGLQETLGD